MEVVRGKIYCMLLQKTRAGAVPLTFHGSYQEPRESRSLEIAIPEEGHLVLLQIDTLSLTFEPILQYCDKDQL